MKIPNPDQRMSRRDFLKLGVASISASALLLAASCVPGDDDDDDDGGDDDD